MDSRYQRIAVYIIIIAVLIGFGYLVYRFIQGPKSTNAKTVTINSEGKFASSELTLANNETIRIKNDDDRRHTVKKSSGDTLVNVNSRSTSRGLDLADNTETTLYLDNDENNKMLIAVGNVPAKEEENNAENPGENPPAVQPPGGQTQGSATNSAGHNEGLPNTGPEGLYLFPFLAGAGFVLAKFSNKILSK